MPEDRTPLEAEFRRRIARTGPIPVAEFMAMCLYDPQHGYYNRRAAFGAAGDFITAPEISQMFGELIGLWAAEVWQSMGAPDRVALIEFGPGRGTMMTDALRAARAAPEFREAVRKRDGLRVFDFADASDFKARSGNRSQRNFLFSMFPHSMH